MEAYQERVIKEFLELSQKLEKLMNFFTTNQFDSLTKTEKFLLKNQARLMEAYASTLEERIPLFKYLPECEK